MRLLIFSTLLLVLAPAAGHAAPPVLESGFHLLYEARFEEARAQFRSWESASPEDPLGHASEAASYLFEEFSRQGVLNSSFFLDDKKLLEGISGNPNEVRRAGFLRAAAMAQVLARRRLAKKPGDTEALFALTMTTGMMADYASLLDKNPIESLKYIRASERDAHELLAIHPEAADAYLTLGITNYIIGSLPLHKRALLWLGGIRGDKQVGIDELSMAAERGDYLRPFAKILLALIDLREQEPAKARTLFTELAAEFPQNPLYARELARLDRATSRSDAGK